MEKKIPISIIIPAYNAEKSIRDCVKSVLSQTLKDIEIIIVDDGSNDFTRSILLELSEQDSRIHLVKKDKNEGLSAARNSGMKVARGEYIGFVDADDWLEEDYLETMYNNGKNADLIVAGYQHDTMDENRKGVYVSRKVSMKGEYWTEKKQIVLQAAYIDTGKMFAYTWNKLYKRELIEQNNFSFPQQVFIEDFIFNTLYWNVVCSLQIIEHTGYHYVKGSKEALTQKFLSDFFDIMYKRFDYIKRLLCKNDVYYGTGKEQLANIYIKHMISGVTRNCVKEGNYSFTEQYRQVKKMLKNKRSREARKNAKGCSNQEKVCNLFFKSKSAFLVLCFGKILYLIQTKTKTVYDRLK